MCKSFRSAPTFAHRSADYIRSCVKAFSLSQKPSTHLRIGKIPSGKQAFRGNFANPRFVSRNTETLRYKFIFLIISIIFTSCQKENIDEINVVNNWNIKRDPYTSGQLVLNENKTFHFTERSHLSETFSNGVWKMKDDTIYLNSKMHNECLYMNSFKPYCEDKYIVTREKIETTIENCQPKNYTRFYTIFQNEKFKFRNDSLFYVNPNKN